ncbi:MAG: MGMT family protein [Candidatus Aenigmarchaeota archaeon]|nr:MGMT family protein [Candidatus Aenigmarchaeota archaeon]
MKSFSEKVLGLTKKIPKGKVTTYSEMARALGNPKASRAVGNALNSNTRPDVIPCYRVVRNDGSVGGYSSGVEQKVSRLKKDGIEVRNGKVDLKGYFHALRK